MKYNTRTTIGIASLVAGLLILIWPNLLVIVVGLTVIQFRYVEKKVNY